MQEVKDISGALAALVSMSSTPGGAASKDGETRGAHRPFKRWESENKEYMRLMKKLASIMRLMRKLRISPHVFQTYLTTWSGRVLSRGLKVEASTKIQKLLQILCEFEGYKINSVQVVLDDVVLEPERSLCSYGIGAGTHLYIGQHQKQVAQRHKENRTAACRNVTEGKCLLRI